ncbi:PQQ-binding-like beta-propeller repeat protein [Sphaerisporangium sp. TRM90804]|uniref:outer membrane protein assembly factor BamB family protein n=1 Tax=Sphaerisporangium sp. TRM90804 TaxID=3031113 RepID=UPI00244A27D6|nr:PQQ-binding-like beta-propeller repeat protein [Sphaerisporangium sp. TRM90804]MDH2428502.1 PQQ-binding-like beta-propeller repeat protein [Sphaerisporangium sp. TRM90804]
MPPQGPPWQVPPPGASAHPPYPGHQQGTPPGAPPDPPSAQADPRHAATAKKAGPLKIVLVAALCVTWLLSLGTGTAYVVAGGFGDDSGTGGAGLWQVPFTVPGFELADRNDSIAFGAWMSGTAVIRAQEDGMHAYDLATGKRVWGTPSPGGQLCSATPDLAGTRGAIAYGTAERCDRVAGVDAATGKILWRVRVPESKERPGLARRGDENLYAPGLWIAGDVLLVRTWGQVSGHRLSDGGKVWTRAIGESCKAVNMVVAASGRAAVSVQCTQGGDSVLLLDGKTGAVAGEHRFKLLGGPDRLISADPAVVAWDDPRDTSFLVMDGAGKAVRQFGAGARIEFAWANRLTYLKGGYEELRAQVRGDTLYVASSPAVRGDVLMAYDLTTGKRLWQSAKPSPTRLTFVRAEDKGLLVMEEGGAYRSVPRLLRVDAATGGTAVVAELPQRAGGESAAARVYYRDGALAIMPFRKADARHALTVVRVEAG